VVATNNGTSAVQRIIVVAVEDTDADGDSLTDDQEQAIGTNPFSPDSDGNGVPDDVEVGSDPDQPLDLDGDGVIDALDTDTMVVQDENGQRIAIKTSAGRVTSAYNQPLSELSARSGDYAEITMESGILGLSIDGLTEGQSVDVTLTFESLPAGIDSYLMFGPILPDAGVPDWYEFADFHINGDEIVLHLTDNQLGDSSPVAGVIGSTGGPGVAPVVAPPPPPPPPPKKKGGGGGAFGLLSIGVLMFHSVYRRRRRRATWSA